MDNRVVRHTIVSATAAILLALTGVPAGAAGGVQTDYLYSLSDFTGTVPYYGAQVFTDNEQFETYVASGNTVDIYGQNGMKEYDFFNDSGILYDVVTIPGGDILLLLAGASGTQIVRCDYRGEPKSAVKLSGLPPDFARDARFNRMVYRDGLLYLADLGNMRVVTVRPDGTFTRGYDIAAFMQIGDEEKRDTGMSGFGVDGEGGILFTVSATAKAGHVTADGRFLLFGKRGSGPGKFGVPSGIAEDRKGNYLVADKLRCVVLIFDKDRRFLKEFGYRGFGRGNLIVPTEIFVDDKDKVYVSQLRARGISVFQLRYP